MSRDAALPQGGTPLLFLRSFLGLGSSICSHFKDVDIQSVGKEVPLSLCAVLFNRSFCVASILEGEDICFLNNRGIFYVLFCKM